MSSMNVHLAASETYVADDISFLRTIVRAIHENSGAVTRDWIEPAYVRDQTNTKVEPDWRNTNKKNIHAIRESDLVIIEGSHDQFDCGHQASIALEYKKPTLVVTRDTPLQDKAIKGISDKSLIVKTYSSENDLCQIVDTFIKENMLDTKDLRFNFFIDRQIYHYLREISYRTGKNKSEIIRELLEQEIEAKGR